MTNQVQCSRLMINTVLSSVVISGQNYAVGLIPGKKVMPSLVLCGNVARLVLCSWLMTSLALSCLLMISLVSSSWVMTSPGG